MPLICFRFFFFLNTNRSILTKIRLEDIHDTWVSTWTCQNLSLKKCRWLKSLCDRYLFLFAALFCVKTFQQIWACTIKFLKNSFPAISGFTPCPPPPPLLIKLLSPQFCSGTLLSNLTWRGKLVRLGSEFRKPFLSDEIDCEQTLR